MAHKTLHESAAEILAASVAAAGKEPVPMATVAQTAVDLGGEMNTGAVTPIGSASSSLVNVSPKPGRPGVPAEPMKTVSPMSGEGEAEEGDESEEMESEEKDENELMEELIQEHGAEMVLESLIAEYGDENVFHSIMEEYTAEYGEDLVNEKFAETLSEEIGEDNVINLVAESVISEFGELQFTDEEFASIQEQSQNFITEMQTLSEEDFDNYVANLTEEELIQAIQLSSLNEEYLVEFLKKIGKALKKGVKAVGKVAGKVLKNPLLSTALSFALPGVGGIAAKLGGKLASTALGKAVSGIGSKIAGSALGKAVGAGVGKLGSTVLGRGALAAGKEALKGGVMSKLQGGSFKQGAIGGAAGSIGGGLGGAVAARTGSNMLGNLVGDVASTKLAGGRSADIKNAALGSVSGGLSALAQSRRQAAAGGDEGGAEDNVATAAADDEPEERVAAAPRPQTPPAGAQRLLALRNRFGAARSVAESVKQNDFNVLLEEIVNQTNQNIEQLDDDSYENIVNESDAFVSAINELSDEELDNYFSDLNEEQLVYVVSLMSLAEARTAPAQAKPSAWSKLKSSKLARAVPVLGTVLGAGYAADRLRAGDYVGAGLGVASMIPGAGLAAVGADIARDYIPGIKSVVGSEGSLQQAASKTKPVQTISRLADPVARVAWDPVMGAVGRALYNDKGESRLANAAGAVRDTTSAAARNVAGAAKNVAGGAARRVASLASNMVPAARAATPAKPAAKPAAPAKTAAAAVKPNVKQQGAVGANLASSSGGMFASKSDRLNQSKVDAVLGKGKFKAGSAEANLALQRHFNKKGTMGESMEIEQTNEEESLLEQNALEFIDHLSTLSEEEAAIIVDQLSDEEAEYIDSLMENRLNLLRGGRGARGARGAGGRGRTPAARPAARPAGGIGKGKAAAATAAGVAAGYGASKAVDALTAKPDKPNKPNKPNKPLSDEEKYGKVGAEIRRLDPEAYKNRPRSAQGNMDLLNQLRKKKAEAEASAPAAEEPAVEPAQEPAAPEQAENDYGKSMLDQLDKDVQDIQSQQPAKPAQAGKGLMRTATGEKTRLRKAIPNELAGIANAFGNLFKAKELGWKPGTDRSGKPKNEGQTMSEEHEEQYEMIDDLNDGLTDEQIQEQRKNSIKETVNQYKGNMREDVDALFNGESLSEDFRVKATLIFESAVTSRVEAILEQVMADNEEVLANAYEDMKGELTEQVDEYLNYVVDQWMAQNQVAIETGLRSELAEDFISGLRALFQEHYIEIPEEKVDVAETLATELADLSTQAQEYIEAQELAIADLQEELNTVKKEKAINNFCEGLTLVQAEKMKSLAESVEFTAEGDFEEKLAVLRENYFPTKVQVKSEVKEIQQAMLNEEPEVEQTNSVMARYVKAIAKTAPKA